MLTRRDFKNTSPSNFCFKSNSLLIGSHIRQLLRFSILRKSFPSHHLKMFPLFQSPTSQKTFKNQLVPWLVWLSGLSTGLRSKGLPVDSQSGHIPGLWVRSPVGGMPEATTH